MGNASKAVFLDRDGTIIEDFGYINTPEMIEFLPGSVEAIKLLNDAGYKIFIVSNQAGIARGLLSEDMLQTIDKIVHKIVLNGGGRIEDSYYCPHHPEHGVYPYKKICECRKPQSGLIKKAAQEHHLDLSQSFMVGDKVSDIEAGQRAGTKTIFVLTGHGRAEQTELKENPDLTANNLLEAARWIIKQAYRDDLRILPGENC